MESTSYIFTSDKTLRSGTYMYKSIMGLMISYNDM